MKYAEGAGNGPDKPRSNASFAQRTASITTPAEFGESHTSSFISSLSGTSPNGHSDPIERTSPRNSSHSSLKK